ncbi:permease [Novispirillum sp. DQ9]|uniref:permease n=1 Tax=Novispirillum sp. DQ9 TaxID=3398612 RepID=UPI003C7E34CA
MFAVFTSLADLVAYDLIGLTPQSGAGTAVHFFVEDTTKIFTLLVVIVFVMGLFRTLLAPEKVRSSLEGKPRSVAYVLAVLLGAVTPFCSCSSVPLFIGFLEAGIPLGATMAFLIASPMINEVAVVILGAVLGWEVTALYVVTGLAVGILGGWLTDRFRMERYVEAYVWKIRMGAVAMPKVDASWRGRARFAAGEVREIVGRIWVYVLIGIGIGAGLHGFVPEDFFARYVSADNLLAVPLAVLAGIPLYSNATGVIPVAEALLAKGVPIGTVLAMMMSVVAISVPEFIILRKVITVRGLAWFAGFLALAFIGVGTMFNALLG